MVRKFTALLASLLILLSYADEELSANAIDVVAVEYPPFTTILREDGGVAFALLEKASEKIQLKLNPLFLPPARASAVIESGDWCASFYPPIAKDKSEQISLSDKHVKIGLIRRKADSTFAWERLDEFRGNSVAILRTSDESPFKHRFTEAGMNVVQVETIHSAIQMVLLGRTDFAMSDNVTYAGLEQTNKKLLEISSTSLLSTPITLFWNQECGIEISALIDELRTSKSKAE